MYNKTFNRVFFVSIDIIKGDKMKKILMCVLLISGVDADEYSVEEIRIAKCMVGFNKIRARTGRNRTTLLGSMCNKHNAILYTDGTYSISPFHDRLNDNCNLTKADVWENAKFGDLAEIPTTVGLYIDIIDLISFHTGLDKSCRLFRYLSKPVLVK